MPRGILETLGLAGSVLFAAPVALWGLERLAGGQPGPGLGYLAVAAGMVIVPRYLLSPTDVATEAAESAAEAVVEVEDGDGEE